MINAHLVKSVLFGELTAPYEHYVVCFCQLAYLQYASFITVKIIVFLFSIRNCLVQNVTEVPKCGTALLSSSLAIWNPQGKLIIMEIIFASIPYMSLIFKKGQMGNALPDRTRIFLLLHNLSWALKEKPLWKSTIVELEKLAAICVNSAIMKDCLLLHQILS